MKTNAELHGLYSIYSRAVQLPKGLLDDLGPEDLLLVQVDSTVTVPHPVGPWVRRDVFCFPCTRKNKKEEQLFSKVITINNNFIPRRTFKIKECVWAIS